MIEGSASDSVGGVNFESSEARRPTEAPPPAPAAAGAAPDSQRPGGGQPFGVGPGVVLSGRYELQTTIASGGMAQVWQGHDKILDRPVAIKILHSHLAHDEGFVARFRREAIASARLSHTSIVAVYDTISDKLNGSDIEAIVMELIRGRTLRALLDENPVLSAKAVVAIGCQIADALGEAHRAGIVHRDIKPANIMIDEDRRVVVTDFGIAKATKDADLTLTGTLLGTAKYLAPEQVSGDAIDPRADIYSLGVVLFEAVTGGVPFQAESDAAIALARLRPPIPRCRERRAGIPVGLDEAIHRAMAMDPAHRFATATELRAALAAVDLTNQAPLSPAPSPSFAGPPPATTGTSPVMAGSSVPSTPPPPPAPSSAPPPPPRDGTAIMAPDMVRGGDVHDPKTRSGKERRRRRRGSDRRTEAGLPTRGEAAPVRQSRGRSLLGRTMVAVLIIVGLLVAGLLAMAGDLFGNVDIGGVGAGAGSTAIVDGFSFDPGSDGDEWGSRVALAYDGESTTRWYSKTYSSPRFSSSKNGVGVIFQLDGEPAVNDLEVTTTTENWSAEVYIADELPFPPDYIGEFSPDQWGDGIGGVSGVSGDTTIDLDRTTGTFVLVWITDHGTTVDREGVTRNRVEFNEVAFG